MWELWNPRVRDTGIYLLGIYGVINELFIVPEPRLYALIFLGPLIGMPLVLGADAARNKQTGEGTR